MDVEFDGVRVERAGRVVVEIPSLRLRSRRTTAILGPNGSGKTTLLRLIAGLERPVTGRVRIGGSLPRRQLLAYMFQEQVFLAQSVRANLELGLRIRRLNQAERRPRAEEAARRLGIEHLLERRADRLSGGEGRRVSLARALCLQAPVVLLDEPLEGLDEPTYARLLDELPPLLAAFDATTLLVTHNRHEALRLADDLVVLVDGRVHAAGDKREIASTPRVREVADVLGYTRLPAGNRYVAVPPGALALGPGVPEFALTVDSVIDLVESREVIGRIADVRVRVALPWAEAAPRRGDRIVVHAERCSELR